MAKTVLRQKTKAESSQFPITKLQQSEQCGADLKTDMRTHGAERQSRKRDLTTQERDCRTTMRIHFTLLSLYSTVVKVVN